MNLNEESKPETQLTTIRIPGCELGKQAAQRLIDRIIKAVIVNPEPVDLVLPAELAVRRTCGSYLHHC